MLPVGTDAMLLEVKKKKVERKKIKIFFLFLEGRACCVIYGFNTASRLSVFISTRHQSYARPYLKLGAHFNQTQEFQLESFQMRFHTKDINIWGKHSNISVY